MGLDSLRSILSSLSLLSAFIYFVCRTTLSLACNVFGYSGSLYAIMMLLCSMCTRDPSMLPIPHDLGVVNNLSIYKL